MFPKPLRYKHCHTFIFLFSFSFLSLLFPSLFFFLAVPLLVRSFAFPLGMVVLKGDLVEEEEVTVGSLLGAKTGWGCSQISRVGV